MPRKPLNEMQIPDLDDSLFKSHQTKIDEKAPRIVDIELDKLVEFPEHPFKVKEDVAMIELSKSIEKSGIMSPAIVRPKDDGTYEMIAGHRKKYASQLIGKETLPCIVRDISDEEATIIMVDTNLQQREEILPSEKAFAYKMKLEAMKSQGNRTDLTSNPLGGKLNGKESAQIIGEEYGESQTQVRRYIRLTELIQPILDMVDENIIALRPAVEISYLSPEQQEHLVEAIEMYDATPSHAQTIVMRKLDQNGELTFDKIDEIMTEEKSNQIEKVKIPTSRIKKFFNPKATEKEMEEHIVKALGVYQKYLERKKNNRDER
ncbi:MAG: ParB/RepB/Spo0J family partition protein [Thomasclavelia ramosa]|nr:ParB/RepB/Spo0J family partition protein [Thomasclavelia ramosa]